MRDLSKFPALGATALALALTAAACGGGDSDITATAGNAQPASDATDTVSDGATDDADVGATADDSATADAGAEGADDAGSDEAAASAPSAPVWASAEESEATANQNIGSLQSAEDVRDIQVLSVHDGAISSLREAVTGDRPVLLWFYAPH